jgi:hypothetical protein
VSAGYSGTPLARKLGIKQGSRVAVLGAPEGLATLLEPLPDSALVQARPKGTRCFDVVLAFATGEDELWKRLARGKALMCESGGLWACWPKQTSSLARRLKQSDVQHCGLATGLVDNKICAIDEDWSGLRFVVRLEHRRAR